MGFVLLLSRETVHQVVVSHPPCVVVSHADGFEETLPSFFPLDLSGFVWLDRTCW